MSRVAGRVCIGLASISTLFLNRHRVSFLHADKTAPLDRTAPPETPRTFTKKQLAMHVSAEKGIYVAYGENVYDITEFIQLHPGGYQKIMQAAGKSIEPYWDNYPFHHKQHIYDQLDRYKIGAYLAQDDDVEETVVDPFDGEPLRETAGFKVHGEKPYACEPDLRVLFEGGHVTPTELFFVRNHFACPEHPGTLRVDSKLGRSGEDESDESVRVWTIEELHALKQVEECVTLQCAGNRRSAMNEKRETSGILWSSGAISTATFKGVPLTTLIPTLSQTLRDSYKNNQRGVGHVLFKGSDGYEASIPLYLSENTIIATHMNGKPMTLDHGYPLRAIVPGVVAARSVKYLTSISLTKHESDSVWHQSDYRICPPFGNKDTLAADMRTSHSIYDTSCQSSIMTPFKGDDVGGECEVGGYAYSGGGRGIRRVDVSCDGGESWQITTLDKEFVDDGRNFDWTLWRSSCIFRSKGKRALLCRAVDSAGNSQPTNQLDIYNVRGVNVNVQDRVEINVV